VKSVVALATWEPTVLKFERIPTTSTTKTTIVLTRTKDGTNRIKGGINNNAPTTMVTTMVIIKAIISTNHPERYDC